MDDLTQVPSISKMVKEEKLVIDDSEDVSTQETTLRDVGFLDKLLLYTKKLDGYGVESRGIERVSSEDRSPQNWVALCLIW